MSISKAAYQKLEEGLKRLGVDAGIDKLAQYLVLLNKWNKAYNLTAVRNVEDMVSRHILDSLALTPWVSGQRIIDVGTGAGLPGIPLAMAFPEKQFVLLDSNGKKMRFLREVKRQLNLSNIELVENRVEAFHSEKPFDVVISRAFSELEKMIQWTKHLKASDGVWLAMKGKQPILELKALSQQVTIHEYQVPGLNEERCCVVIQ